MFQFVTHYWLNFGCSIGTIKKRKTIWFKVGPHLTVQMLKSLMLNVGFHEKPNKKKNAYVIVGKWPGRLSLGSVLSTAL